MNRFLVEVCPMHLNYLEFKFNRYPMFCYCHFFGDFSLFLSQIWQLYFLCSQGVSGVRLCVPSCSGGFFPLLSPLPLTFPLLLLRWVQTAPCSAQTTLLSYSDTLLNLPFHQVGQLLWGKHQKPHSEKFYIKKMK